MRAIDELIEGLKLIASNNEECEIYIRNNEILAGAESDDLIANDLIFYKWDRDFDTKLWRFQLPTFGE